MQYKIPQEMNVEDKVIGPFTLKQFGFVFVAAMVTAMVMILLTNLGMSMITSLIIGGFLGSFSLLVCFIPYNGKPLYTFAVPFANFFIKPKQRVWKKTNEPQKKLPPGNENITETESAVQTAPQKESLKNAERKIEEISLMVDTGGSYGIPQAAKDEASPGTVFDKASPTVDKTLTEARKKVEKQSAPKEPPVSDLATVDPDKKFEYEKPDTSKYKLE